MRLLRVLPLVLLVALGCSEKKPRISLDSGVPTDGSTPTDGHVDGAPDPDGSSDPDSGNPDDFDAGPGNQGPVCQPGTACGGGDSCATGTVCMTNACGDKVCVGRGAVCGSSDECSTGSSCVGSSTGGHCSPANGEVCNASTDCPPNHACQGGPGARSCVLRRVPCEDESECPVSYLCLASEGEPSTCQYGYRPCDSVGTCSFQVCSDLDGDTTLECGGGGGCETNADCTGDDRCVLTPTGAACGRGGLCDPGVSGTCGNGFTCRDLRGDGYAECVATGGSCTSQADCSAGSICGVAVVGQAPRCIAAM